MASPLSISIDLGIADIIARLHEWWRDVVARGDARKNEVTRTSGKHLAVCLVRMAGLMDTFAYELMMAHHRGWPRRSRTIVRELDRIFEK